MTFPPTAQKQISEEVDYAIRQQVVGDGFRAAAALGSFLANEIELEHFQREIMDRIKILEQPLTKENVDQHYTAAAELSAVASAYTYRILKADAMGLFDKKTEET